MPLTKKNLKSTLKKAWKETWDEAKEISIDPENPRPTEYEQRSAAWVNCLAKQLQTVYRDQEGYRVFWRKRSEKLFNKREFLFDVMVCRLGYVNSREPKPKPLEYIKACEWAIESEFNNGSRAIIEDFSKLVCAASKNKLFVTSHHSDRDKNQDILCQCSALAKNCSGEIYFCFIKHPENWDDQRNPPSLYEWKKGDGWTPL